MYENIGGKIKSLALWCFILEAFSAIISAIFIFAYNAEDLWFYGVLLLILGPFAAWVSSWLLYGFGELIEKTSQNKANTAAILKILKNLENKDNNYKENNNKQTNQTESKTSNDNIVKGNETITANTSSQDTIKCPECGFEQKKGRLVCWKCGVRFQNFSETTLCPSCGTELKKGRSSCFKCGTTFPYYCGSCGHFGPYEGNCPECNSSIKKYPSNEE